MNRSLSDCGLSFKETSAQWLEYNTHNNNKNKPGKLGQPKPKCSRAKLNSPDNPVVVLSSPQGIPGALISQSFLFLYLSVFGQYIFKSVYV